MAVWIATNTIKVGAGAGKGTFVIREGDLIDDTLYNMTQLFGAGLQAVPAGDTAGAAMQVFSKKQARKGNRDDARIAQPQWGPYIRKGQVTITAANTTGALTLSPVEQDTNYFVQVTPTAITGTSNVALCDIQSVAKANGSVTLTLQAAPGAGNGVTFDILIVR